MAQPRIRSLEPADAPAVAAFFADAALGDPTIVPLDADGWRRFVGRSFNRGGRDFAVADLEGEVVAVLTSTLMAEGDPPPRHFRILVHSDHRRRGIGTALLELVRRQDADGGAPLQCNCEDGWDAGRAFLAARGFGLARRELDMARAGSAPEPVPAPAGIRVREGLATPDDDAAWIRLNREGYAGDPNAQRLGRADTALLRAEIGFRLWLADAGAGAVGFCHAVQAGDGGRIESLVVARTHRRRGVGRSLMVETLRAMLGAGAGLVTLGVRAENAGAIALYRSLEFESIGEVTTWRSDAGS